MLIFKISNSELAINFNFITMQNFIILSLLFLTSCASIVSDSDYIVKIKSEPKGANFTISDKNNIEIESGQTPADVILKSGDGYFTKAEYQISYSKDGYNSEYTRIKAKIDPWYFGNIIFGGIIGLFIIDPVTGAMYELPDSVNTELNRNSEN